MGMAPVPLMLPKLLWFRFDKPKLNIEVVVVVAAVVVVVEIVVVW